MSSNRLLKIIRAAVFFRAGGRCEACGRHITEESGHLDHFFGRAKVKEAVSNCWALCFECDSKKTVNSPSAAYWLSLFRVHAWRHRYAVELEMAGAKLQVLRAKGLAA